jgi:hypothetical protein
MTRFLSSNTIIASLQLAALSLLVSGSLQAQQPSEWTDPGDDIQAWIGVLDKRLYAPPPLQALDFFLRPATTGEDGGKAELPYLLRYRYRRDKGDRLDFYDLEKKSLEILPGATTEFMEDLRKNYLGLMQEHASIIIGRRFKEQYADYHGTVRRRRVNGIEEITLDLEPKSHPRLRRVQISLSRERLPWRIEKTYRNGDAIVQHPSFEERPEGFIFVKFSESRTHANPDQKPFGLARVFRWQRVQGLLLLAETEVSSKELSPLMVGKATYLDMRINDAVEPFEEAGK